MRVPIGSAAAAEGPANIGHFNHDAVLVTSHNHNRFEIGCPIYIAMIKYETKQLRQFRWRQRAHDVNPLLFSSNCTRALYANNNGRGRSRYALNVAYIGWNGV